MFWGLITAAWAANDNRDTGANDEALVAAAQRGSAEAVTALHARYYSRIYRLAYFKTSNAADAEDIASETFVRMLASLPSFRFKAVPSGVRPSLYPWLHRITLNLIVDSSRQRPPAGVVSLDAPVIDGLRVLLSDRLPAAGEGMAPQEIVERLEVQQMVRGAIAALPADQGDVLVYRFLGELTAAEIAPLMHRSESAVKSLLHRAVVALRTEIERRVSAIERLENNRQDSLRGGTQQAAETLQRP